MRVFSGVLIAALALFAQEATTPSKEAPINEAKGMPPRAAPTEYQAHAQAGAIAIGAEFMGHAVPTPEATFSTDDYVVVEVGFFGSPEARIRLFSGDFSFRINGKKGGKLMASQPYAMVFKSLKDPEWQPPVQEESKSKTTFGGVGRGDSASAPAPVHMPFELQRTMQLRVQRAALPEGDRALPVAGLIFFEHRGKTENLHSIDLIYEGPAGKAILALQP